MSYCLFLGIYGLLIGQSGNLTATTYVKVFLFPIEEWLFFVIIPFACVFIHEGNYFFNKELESNTYVKISFSCVNISSIICYMVR